jgi:hypothetical protein
MTTMRFRFNIRDLIWLTAVIGLTVALILNIVENNRLLFRRSLLEDRVTTP